MTDTEVQDEFQLDSSPPGQPPLREPLPEDSCCEASDRAEGLLNFGYRDREEPLLLLADVALAPPCGRHASCSCLEALHSIQLRLQFLLSKADNLKDCLVSGQSHLEREALVAAVSSLLFTCRPFFNYLESTARSTVLQNTHHPVDVYNMTENFCSVCVQLLDFSQQLCDRLEQLVLIYASYDFLSLDETEPNNLSHFCIGQSQLGQLRVTIFRYCKPTPYLARVNSGLYKRMRWNVERLLDEQQRREEEQVGGCEGRRDKRDCHTDHYFLCYEDISNVHAEADRDNQEFSCDSVMRMWSIGQWVQVNPDPKTEDIYDWITCEVPQASYCRLLFLGHEEPSSCNATDCLQQLLLSQHTD
ncbi:UPF0575 protein C19orf67 homolog [Leuresthes tenuis]|uniref:UPF0575 protein C19orf67 homolog n=1 Tax=Leuresthes tenuis TaxID=355514 RepID=UPI003B5092CC